LNEPPIKKRFRLGKSDISNYENQAFGVGLNQLYVYALRFRAQFYLIKKKTYGLPFAQDKGFLIMLQR